MAAKNGPSKKEPLFVVAPELIVVAKPEAGLRVRGESISSISRAIPRSEVTSLQRLSTSINFVLQPLFGLSEDRLQRRAKSLADASPDAGVPDLSIYYKVDAPRQKLEEIAQSLIEHNLIETAYIKPGAEPPLWQSNVLPTFDEPPAVTPDFTSRQGYLLAAPGGIDAVHAWTLNGGRGADVQIIDIEGAWRFMHEDLLQNSGGVVGGTPSTDLSWRNHGTAVIGEFGADVNGTGVTGICPDAIVRAISIFSASGSASSAAAISQAADRLRPGDIMLIELHRPGPRHNFTNRNDQAGYIAVEWWPDDFDAIRYAVGKGVIVVEAAGNGGENFDDSLYDTPASGFPPGWTNPFNRSNRDSGAILVGAGAPPSGTHGREDHGPDRSRLSFSNYGASIDAQGWGREVTTTGYGDLQGGTNEDLWYTDTFAGTSSASPIVVGTIGCVQGVLRANGRIPLSPARVRELLRSTGSPQQDAIGRPVSQRIGNRPNIRELITAASAQQTWTGEQFRGTVPANQTARWFTHSWPAHWHVVWTIVPVSVGTGAPQISWRVQVERTSDALITYWLNVNNKSSAPVEIAARFAVLGW